MFTLKIELRVDHDSPEKDEIIKEAAKVAAKHLYTTALLIQDKRKPIIAMQGGDFFTAEEEILLADDIPEGDKNDTVGGSVNHMPDDSEAPRPTMNPIDLQDCAGGYHQWVGDGEGTCVVCGVDSEDPVAT